MAEVARDIGKSAQGLHYHVNQLVDVGLLIAAGERKRHARIEALYVWSSANILYESGGSKPYREQYVRAFSAVARARAVWNRAMMGRSREASCRSVMRSRDS